MWFCVSIFTFTLIFINYKIHDTKCGRGTVRLFISVGGTSGGNCPGGKCLGNVCTPEMMYVVAVLLI